VSQAIEPLAISMIEPAFSALLVSTVGFASLLAPTFLAAPVTTVSVSSVASGADEKHCPALVGPTKPLSKYQIAGIGHRSGRRRSTPASEYGKIAPLCWCYLGNEIAKQRTPVAYYNRGSLLPPDARYYQTS